MATANIDEPRTSELARWLAEMEGTGQTGAAGIALLEEREPARVGVEDPDAVYRGILSVADKAAEEPSVDRRTSQDIIGYDESGLPI